MRAAERLPSGVISPGHGVVGSVNPAEKEVGDINIHTDGIHHGEVEWKKQEQKNMGIVAVGKEGKRVKERVR